MSASKKSQLKKITRLGVIAGGGDMPRQLIDHCSEQGIECFVVGFKGQTKEETIEGVDHMLVALGSASKAFAPLKDRDIHDLVMIGNIRRPSFKDLKPNFKTIEFFAKEGFSAFGDDGLLKGLRRFLAKEGFEIHGMQDFMPDLLAPEGDIGTVKPSQADMDDIRRGIDVLQHIGSLDIGQAVIVQQGHVLGVEGAEGTDEFIQRCGPLQRKGKPAVLVKLCKPQQDQSLDLPTIGPQTIDNIISAGFSGVAVHAGSSFIYDLDKVVVKANKANIFITGIDAEVFKGNPDE